MSVHAPSRRVLALLGVLAILELATLGVLLTNLFTAHIRVISQVMGPIHGAVYLTIVVIVIFAPGLRVIDRILGCIPVVGGAIAVVRAVRMRRRPRFSARRRGERS